MKRMFVAGVIVKSPGQEVRVMMTGTKTLVWAAKGSSTIMRHKPAKQGIVSPLDESEQAWS